MVSLVRFGHFSPDAPAVDILIDEEVVFENLSFEEITEFLEMEDGNYMFEIRPHGESASIISEPVDILDELSHTIIISGLVGEDDIGLVVIEDSAV